MPIISPMASEAWQWLSYGEPFWGWPADMDGRDYFDDDDALEQAIFAVMVRRALEDLVTYFPDRRLITLADQLRHAVDLVQADLVAEARSQGVSWTRIGIALEVGRTAAQKRYGHGLAMERCDQLERESVAAIEWARDNIEQERGGETPDDEFLSILDAFLTRISTRRKAVK